MAITKTINSGTIYASYDNVKETFPESAATTGSGADTVDVVSKNVFGTGTAFKSDFRKGGFVWLTTNDELRRINNIVSDTKMTLEHPATNVTGETIKSIDIMGFDSVSYIIDSVGAANINGIPLPAEASETFKTDVHFFPILIDSTPNANTVTVTAKNI